MNLIETDKAHIAGLFDGEGLVGLYSNKKNLAPKVNITNSDPRVMKWLYDKVGYGSLYCRIERRHNYYNVWTWQLTNRLHIQEFLAAIRAYLKVKIDQVDLLLSLLDAEQKVCRSKRSRVPMELRSKREEVYTELRRLKTANYQSVH